MSETTPLSTSERKVPRSVVQEILPALSLIVLAVGVYFPSLGGGFFWDDYSLAQGQLLERPLHEFWRYPPRLALEEHYWPVTYTVFWSLHKLSGFDPFTFRLANVLLHAANTLLALALLRRLGVRCAWFGAALFAVHPTHVESVAWIIELKDVLSGFLFLSATLLYLRKSATESHPRRALTMAAAGILYALAVWSKTVAISWPLVLAILLWGYDATRLKKDFPVFLLYAGLGALLLWLDLQVVARTAHAQVFLSIGERLELVGRAFWWYVAKLIWPAPLLALYPRWELGAGGISRFLPTFAMICAVLVAVLWGLRSNAGRTVVVWLLWFLLLLLPTLGGVPHSFMIHSFVADRYLYLASLGPCALLSVGLSYLWEQMALQRLKRLLLAGGAAVILTIFGSMSLMHAALYSQPINLLRHTLRHNPQSANFRVMLGAMLAQRGQLLEAAEHFRKATELSPEETAARANLAVVSWQLGDLDSALVETSAVLSTTPKHAMCWAVRAASLAAKGLTRQAQEAAQRALELDPQQQLALRILRGEITTGTVSERSGN